MPGVSILTSGIGLGIYMPALLIQRRLRAAGVNAEVEVLEGYFTPEGQQRHLAHRQAYHDNFDLALMAHRMARSVEGSLDQPRIGALLGRWATERRRHFIVWSGFWLPILVRLERLRQRGELALEVDLCRIDAVVSASFRVHEGLAPDAREIWLWSWEDRRTAYEIPVGDEPPLAFAERDHRLVVHGGGWGLGTYRQALAAMGGTGWSCDAVVHDPTEAAGSQPGARAFMVDRDWRTWHLREGAHTFPPLGEVGGAGAGDGHALFELIRRSKAIISKPGGGTLIDSLASATPVVLLEPYGYAEERNGALWEHLGFGVPYARWRDDGCDPAVLERLHENLLRRPRGLDYPRRYAEQLLELERREDA